MKVVRHRLIGAGGQALPYIESPSGSDKLSSHEHPITHYTAGSDFDGGFARLTPRRARVSAHLVIGRDGRIDRQVPCLSIAQPGTPDTAVGTAGGGGNSSGGL
jgi:hypothetical protein